MSFSERNLLKSESVEIQTTSIDIKLRISIWNVFLSRLFSRCIINSYGEITQEYYIFPALWRGFFKLPMDDFERQMSDRKAWYRDYLETVEWPKIYDLIEFIATKLVPAESEGYCAEINEALQNNNSAYRLVGNYILAAPQEIGLKSIESAILSAELFGLDALGKHLLEACRHLRPQSLNPIESVKAVVQASQSLFLQINTQTSPEIKCLISWFEFHFPEIPTIFYSGAASLLKNNGEYLNASMSMKDAKLIGAADAEFIFTQCAAFFDYLLQKSSQKGILLPLAHSRAEKAKSKSNIWGERIQQ